MPPTNANPLAQQQQHHQQMTPPTSTKDNAQRPPLYNAEDYAGALRALFSTSFNLSSPPPPPTSIILEHATTHPPLIPGQGLVDMNNHVMKQQKPEMSMKKFLNGSELLFKLEADLRSAFPSFVQEFVSGDSDGVTCILDALRSIHEALDHVQGLREQRKLVLDERSCVQCLSLMMRNLDAIPKLLSYAHGLYPIVHCTVSTNTSTRVLALEILTTVCEQGGVDAYAKVSEAVSTLRLRLGEPIRCKVLVGAISSASAGVFQATGIKFLRSFVQSAPSAKFKVYLQVELEEAGLNVDVIRKSAELSPARESRLVLQEIEDWDRVCVDVDTVVRQNSQLRNSVATLQQEIATLKDRIKKQDQVPQQQQQQPQSKFTKKRQQQQQPPRNLSSTPIQTITTPVDSEEEAEQIHQILEDLNNIVNNEMLQDGSTTTTSSEIVPVLQNTSRPPKYALTRPVASEPNLLFESERCSSIMINDHNQDNSNNERTRVKHVVQQLENSSSTSSSVFSTLPNFNTGGLASKFANFKSSKLESAWNNNNNDNNFQEPGRVKSLENLDNFTLKWKYPVVVDNKHQSHQQPNSLLVLQDYRMNRFGGGGSGGGGSSSGGGGGGNGKKEASRGSPGLFSKNKNKKKNVAAVSQVKGYNDLGGGMTSGGGGSSPERVTDLPSGMY